MELWLPTKEVVEKANVTAFIKIVEGIIGTKFKDFHSFRDWTVNDPVQFWAECAKFCGLVFKKQPESILLNNNAMPGAKWFNGAELNYTENLLRFNDDKPAIIFWNEKGIQNRFTYSELRKEVLKVRAFLQSKGIKKGDAVAAYMPNLPETVICFLATASLGALWSSSSPDFTAKAVFERFSQIKPKVLIAADGYLFKGNEISSISSVRDLMRQIPSIESLLLCPYLGLDCGEVSNSKLYTDLEDQSGELAFEGFPSNIPLLALYSSGTTGKPKCIVHGAIGILLEHAKEHCLEVDIKRDDIVFYNTTCGWMMWNWLCGVLFQGAAIVLFDGFALQKSGDNYSILEMLDKEKVTVFGTSAAFLQKIEELGIEPKRDYKLPALRSILSTGSRLKPESFDYVYRSFGSVHLSPIWGGTDLCGCLGLSSPLLPVRRGEIQTRGLGMAVDVVNENCQSVMDEAGEVVVRKPFPSMPIYFLNDPGGAKYKSAYFEHFPGIWRHGDLAILTKSQGVIVLGRSDDTLNPGGVRIGASEITQVAESHPEVLEAIAVPQEWNGDERIILFLIMKEGQQLTEELEARIVAAMPSPRHRPKKIITVPDFPTTLSGKRSAKSIKDAINGKAESNKDALANPQILDFYQSIPEIKID